MLELYHHGSSVCAAKVRLSLEEKKMDWVGHYLDILAGDQFNPDYLKLNSKGVVPTLVDDGFVVTESSIICEYLEDINIDKSLRPKKPEDHVKQLYWSKAVDEELHPACGELTFAASHRFTVLKLGETKVKEFLDSTPEKSVTSKWHERKKEIVRLGFKAPRMEDTIKLYNSYLLKMEDSLSHFTWLAGQEFSLADTAMLPYVMRLDMLNYGGLWNNNRLPKVGEWLLRCKSRESFEAAIWKWMPDSLTNDLYENGTNSWPEVAKILKVE